MRPFEHVNRIRQSRMPRIAAVGLITFCLAVSSSCTAQDLSSSPFNAEVGRGDWPQLGGTPHRNNTPEGKNIPTDWDIKTGRNIKWSVPLGSETYGNVVVANGNVYVGTNNGSAYLELYPSSVDLGVLLCFRESDGEFLWQHSSEKLPTGRVHDWPHQGICSSPVVEGERLWFVTSRGEVVCLDTQGFHDDEDDGPVTGVWEPVFDVDSGLKNWTDATQPGILTPRLEVTLRSLVKALDPAVRNQYFLEAKAGANQWIANTGRYENPPVNRTLFQVVHTPEALTFTGLNGSDNEIVINLDVLAGLNEGQLSPALKLLFASEGIELSEETRPTVVRTDESWMLNTSVEGISTTFRLGRQNASLVCERLITPNLMKEADVVWSFNMMNELGVRQHNMATCAPTIWGDVLFICTSNGVDLTHVDIPAPDAPSFMAMDKLTGKVLWTDNSPGDNILHGQWSCPVVGVFDGVPQVIFAGGDGWLYSFRADRWNDGKPELLWKFDGNPKDSIYHLGGRSTRNSIIAIPVICDGLVYLALGEDPEHGEAQGHLWCIDPTKRGDVSPELVMMENGEVAPQRRLQAFVQLRAGKVTTEKLVPNPNSAAVWHYVGEDTTKFESTMHRTLGSPAIKNNLLFITDLSGLVHCLNAKTGLPYWTCDLFAANWTTPLIVGETVYVADEDGDVALLALSSDPTKSLKKGEEAGGPLHAPLREINMGSSVYTMPIIANDVLYIASRNRLFAIAHELQK
ncbi:MAG: PQQ-binding-like beta-propeller repeat protein [Planctomycetaceae bacterium]